MLSMDVVVLLPGSRHTHDVSGNLPEESLPENLVTLLSFQCGCCPGHELQACTSLEALQGMLGPFNLVLRDYQE